MGSAWAVNRHGDNLRNWRLRCRLAYMVLPDAAACTEQRASQQCQQQHHS
jgi:hypothetical protein